MATVGDFKQAKVTVTSKDEFGYLGDNFNEMLVGLTTNISQREQAQEALQDSEEMYRTVTETAADAIYQLDSTGKLLFMNEAGARMYGYEREEIVEKNFAELVSKERLPEATKLVGKVLSGETVQGELYVKHKKGHEFLINFTLAPVIKSGEVTGFAGTSRDITKVKEMQEKLVHQEKLATLGELAGGVGHELRNPLGAIKQAAYFLNMALEKPEPEVKETVDILQKEVATSERIISSLLDFARPKPVTPRKVDINDVVREALSHTTVPENIEVVRQPGEALPAILAEPDQLRQVFENIIFNAIQAMPEGGQLVVKAEVPSPRWMAVSFADTGVGIPKKDLKMIFEPLFTTKAKGIGLGLAVTRTIVENHGGTIEAKSEAGKGSTFTVRLPMGAREEK